LINALQLKRALAGTVSGIETWESSLLWFSICHGLELHADFMHNPMTFDALWRANLAQEQRRTDTPKGQEMPGIQTVVVKDTKDLNLTDEDRILLLQVGIKP
jgi:hypothetical protein